MPAEKPNHTQRSKIAGIHWLSVTEGIEVSGALALTGVELGEPTVVLRAK